jgi:cytochrome c-type biogenesis protein CcmH/NrfG
VRDRLRDEAQNDRDYEILDMMAEGIRPILDRLEDIEGRIGDMETGDQPVPSDIRGWLNSQIADTLADPRVGGHGAPNRSMQDLEARLPQMIEQAVTSRFQQMAGKLQKEIEDTHVRTLETFVKNIQVKLVQRVAALETDMTKQAEAMKQLREYSERTEDNLSRLITGVDKLAQDLPRRLQAAPTAAGETVEATPATPLSARPLKRKSTSRHFTLKAVWAAVAVVVVLAAGALLIRRTSSPAHTDSAAPVGAAAPGASAASAETKAPAAPAANADTKTKMDVAQQYSDRKEYSSAEDIYRQVLKAEPNNVDAMKALASVLYREDKIEESAAILDKLPRN